MTSRRSVFGLFGGALLAPFLGWGWAVARPAIAAKPLSPGFYLVDGWILTEGDLEALRRHAA